MKMFGVCLLVFGALVLATANGAMPADRTSQTVETGKGGTAPAKKKPTITVSKETTYALGPLDKDGYIDYVAALNERLGKDILVANNAAATFCKVFGPRPEGTQLDVKFYKCLGIDEPPEKGEYFLTISKYGKQHLKLVPGEEYRVLLDQPDFAGKRAWTAKQYPNVAAWLKINEKPLALAIEATKQAQYYYPLVPGKKATVGLINSLLPHVQMCRHLTSAFTARAMLHLGEGRHDEAWQDLLACHRLGRQVARGGTLIEGLVGIAIDQIASDRDVVYLDTAQQSAQQIKKRLSDLQKLPAMPPMADKVDLGERFVCLEAFVLMERHGVENAMAVLEGGKPGKANNPFAQMFQLPIDWDTALRNGNKWFDKMTAALREKDRANRQPKLKQVENEVKLLVKKAASVSTADKLLMSAKDRGKMISDVMLGLLMPACAKVQDAFDRSEQVQRNLHFAFALVAYQRDHKSYPKKLEALAPAYLAQIPLDLFSDKALIYQPSETGFLLYSVGPNGKDEKGHWYDDNPPGDDPRIRLPLPKPNVPKMECSVKF